MDAINWHFGLSYANFLVMPRALLQSMPDEWQDSFVELLREYDTHWSELPDNFTPRGYRVQPTVNGRLAPWGDYDLPHYNRGRTVVEPDGTVRRNG